MKLSEYAFYKSPNISDASFNKGCFIEVERVEKNVQDILKERASSNFS
jgi:hypothetical protein